MMLLLRLATIFAGSVILLGCSTGWVRVDDFHDVHFVDESLTKPQMVEAIIEGARDAGWRARDLGNDTVLATYAVRVHSVQVEIDVGDGFYVTRYKSSSGMKVFCTQRDRDYLRNMKITGEQQCPGFSNPAYIHSAYQTWMNALNASIQHEISVAR